MLPTTDFKKIRANMEAYDANRETLIKLGRDLLKDSKQLIYALHLDDRVRIRQLLSSVRRRKKALDQIARKHPGLKYEGSYSEANQEYVEAMAYHSFVTGKKLPRQAALAVSETDYLLGLIDLTGELTRRAVILATKRDTVRFDKILRLVQDLHGEFLKFNLRNGLLRKKSDTIKWNLKKLEELAYDVGKNAHTC